MVSAEIGAERSGGCAFEDFLTRRFRSGAENPVEAYLRRGGWKERALTRSYMAALQASVMNLCEVSDIVSGASFRARDLIRGAEPVLVIEHSAIRTLKPWDWIAARIVQQGSNTILSGGLLAFTLEGSQSLFAQLEECYAHVIKRGRRARSSLAALEGWAGTDAELQHAALLFTTVWLFDVLPRACGTVRPTLLNSDGDEVVFRTVSFPLTPNTAREEIARRLSARGAAFPWVAARRCSARQAARAVRAASRSTRRRSRAVGTTRCTPPPPTA